MQTGWSGVRRAAGAFQAWRPGFLLPHAAEERGRGGCFHVKGKRRKHRPPAFLPSSLWLCWAGSFFVNSASRQLQHGELAP